MKVTIKGRIKRHGEVQTFASGFQKQEVVISPNPEGDYPDYFPIELMKDMVGDMDGIKAGTLVEVQAYLGGREYNDRYYLSLKYVNCKVIDPVQDVTPPTAVEPAPAPAADDDDLLF